MSIKMRSIHISRHTTPDQYELGEVPSLVVESPTDILIKVHAASINPIDVKKASGVTKLVLKDRCDSSGRPAYNRSNCSAVSHTRLAMIVPVLSRTSDLR